MRKPITLYHAYTYHVHVVAGRVFHENALLVHNVQVLQRLRLFRVFDGPQDVWKPNDTALALGRCACAVVHSVGRLTVNGVLQFQQAAVAERLHQFARVHGLLARGRIVFGLHSAVRVVRGGGAGGELRQFRNDAVHCWGINAADGLIAKEREHCCTSWLVVLVSARYR